MAEIAFRKPAGAEWCYLLTPSLSQPVKFPGWKMHVPPANLELRSSTNANTAAVAKITVERGWRVGKKVSLRVFFG